VKTITKANKIFSFIIQHILHNDELENLGHRVINICRKVIYIQRRIKIRIKAKIAKKEIFHTKWERTLFKLNMAASNKNLDEELNSKLREFVKHIMLTPKSIQDYIADIYIDCCINLQAIAFLQWRKLNNPKFKF